MLLLMLYVLRNRLGRIVAFTIREWNHGFLQSRPRPVVLRRQRAGRRDGPVSVRRR